MYLLSVWEKLGLAIGTPRLSLEQRAELAALVEAGSGRQTDGMVQWQRADLKRVIKKRFGVDLHERYVGTLLKKLSSAAFI
jgi:transposase